MDFVSKKPSLHSSSSVCHKIVKMIVTLTIVMIIIIRIIMIIKMQDFLTS